MKLFNAVHVCCCLAAGSIVTPSTGYGQAAHKKAIIFSTGYQYLTRTSQLTPFRYTRSFRGTGPLFTTVYKLYHPTKGTPFLTITAKHDKPAQTVVVEVADTQGSIFSQINQEETTYEGTPVTGFGFRGAVGGLFGKRIPNQLGLQFTSRRAEQVKVLSVLGEHEGNDFEFFTLEAETVLPQLPKGPKPVRPVQAQSVASSPLTRDTSTTRPYTFIEQMPEYEGGQQALNYFIYKNTQYPALASRNGIIGRVFVQVVIDETGQLGEPTILKGLGNGCDEEALRVIRLLPAFTPGKQGGVPVKVNYTMTVSFAPRY
ncbi:energy transducer TonB [Hymenobacter sp.]|uniref:energy transducer TonB n=1 Tax=Hymenobacter sp. TaxID=1898978 RepID=UPI00286B0C9C|nr:energy transducer TonB [Hymenobacter sp.]